MLFSDDSGGKTVIKMVVVDSMLLSFFSLLGLSYS